MKRSVVLTIILISSMAAPAVGFGGQHTATDGQVAPESISQESADPEWNLTVNETERIPNRLDSSNGFVFVSGHSFPSATSTVSPAVHVLDGPNTTDMLATKVVADGQWTKESSKRFDGIAIENTLIVRYGRSISAVAKRGGEWKQFDLGQIDGQFETMFATDSAVFVASRSGIRKYSVGEQPSELAHYNTEYELERAAYANGTITFETLDDAPCNASGASGCSGDIEDGSRYGGLDTNLNERWTQFVPQEYVISNRIGDLLLTRPGSQSTFAARDVETGEPVWTWDGPNDGYIAESLRGDIRFWTNNNQAYVVDAETGRERWEYDQKSILYESDSRVFQHVEGEYILRDHATGEVLARHTGPEPPRIPDTEWNRVAVLDGGQYLSFTVEPAPTRVFVNTTTGETVTTFEPPERVVTAYEQSREYPDARVMISSFQTMGEPGSFAVRIGIRGETNTSDLYKRSVFVRPSGHEWFELDGAPSTSNLAVGQLLQTDRKLFYTTVDELADAEGVARDESIRVRGLNGTYLGEATLYRADLDKPMAESKEIPQRELGEFNNERLTRENYRVELAALGPMGQVQYVEPYGHEGDFTTTLRFTIQSIDPEAMTADITVRCQDGQPQAVLSNPTSLPLVYSVSGVDTEITLGAGESRTVELSDSAHTVQVETTTGDVVEPAFTTNGDTAIEAGDTISTECRQEPTGTGTTESTNSEVTTETSGSLPGFTSLVSVIALLIVCCLRYRDSN